MATDSETFDFTGIVTGKSVAEKAEVFCTSTPYRHGEFAKRNWGGQLHSLCSYQGKLKPSIAHFLVHWFTNPGERVLDPMAGVGTIPLEARRMGRTGIASDLSPLAISVSRAKLEKFENSEVWRGMQMLADFVANSGFELSEEDVKFGLNGPIEAYFHAETLKEIGKAREFFLHESFELDPVARDVIKTGLLHILHGNRPYALSRRSHPMTPFAPNGPTIYRPVIAALESRLHRVLGPLKSLEELGPEGEARNCDFRNLSFEAPVDAVITSPPFTESIRFWSSNWMRLWFSGWSPEDFKNEPSNYLEVQQRSDFAVYTSFASAMANIIKPGGILILHLGETARVNMVQAIKPLLEEHFEIQFIGPESVSGMEKHGLRDKGSTLAHWYLFATRR